MTTKIIPGYGVKKFLPALVIQFCLAFSYIILQDVKTLLVVEHGGANLLLTVSAWAGTPMSLVLVWAYIKVTNTVRRQFHFPTFIVPILAYFLLYAFYFYSHPSAFHISTQHMIDLQMKYPGFDKLILMFGYWTTSLFFMLADVWAGFIVGVLFWQHLNDTTTVPEAKAFYPLFGLFVTFGMMVSKAVTFSIKSAAIHAYNVVPLLISLVAGVSIIAMVTHYLIYKNVIRKERNPDKVYDVKLKMSFFQVLGHVFTSKYLGLIAVMTFCFGAILKLMDMLYTAYSTKMETLARLGDQYAELQAQLGVISTSFGFLFSIATVTLSIYLLKKKGWFKAALVSYGIMVVAAIGLLYVSYDESLSKDFSPFAYGLVFCLVMLAKQMKYFFFKPMKEMAYIPLPAELKVKGKAFVDLFVDRFAFSFGVVVFSISNVVAPGSYEIESLIYRVTLLIIILSFIYLMAIWALAPRFKTLYRLDAR